MGIAFFFLPMIQNSTRLRLSGPSRFPSIAAVARRPCFGTRLPIPRTHALPRRKLRVKAVVPSHDGRRRSGGAKKNIYPRRA